MHLNPKLPPGRSSRKALRYVHEVRRLRAEGHTLQSIRRALLDVGVSVSVSTVRREVARPPSKWELEHPHVVRPAPEELQPTTEALATMPSPQPLDANSGPPAGPSDGERGPARIEAIGDRGTFGLLSKIFGVLRRLRRAKRFP